MPSCWPRPFDVCWKGRGREPDLDEQFSLYPLDPEEGLRRLLGAESVDDASDDDMEEEDS